MELQEVSKMEIDGGRLPEENIKKPVFENDEPDPSGLADWQYKDWLETQYLRELEDEREKREEQKGTKG